MVNVEMPFTICLEACLDPFDHGYMNQCGVEQWREHYFFDHETKKCKQFWYDGCPGSSRNIFSKLHACELLCEFGHALDRAGKLLGLWIICFKSTVI